jgi:hypothetical protein
MLATLDIASNIIVNSNLGNNFDGEGMCLISKALQVNSTLTWVDLSCIIRFLILGCKIGNEGMALLSEALKVNRGLKTLTLACMLAFD